MKCELTPKWTEEKLIDAIYKIALLCSSGLITWDEKEYALVNLLDLAGWTRLELKDLNRRKAANLN